MKILKFFSGILTGVLFLEVVMRLVSPIIGPPQTVWQIQQQAKVIKIRERPADLGSIDLITLGDSTGKEGIDPDILDFSVGKGFHSFNASLNSSTTYTIYLRAVINGGGAGTAYYNINYAGNGITLMEIAG